MNATTISSTSRGDFSWKSVAKIGLTVAALIALPGVALFGAGSANAATITYYLNNTNVNPYLADGTDYIQVDITDGVTAGADAAGDSVRFDVTILGTVPVTSGGAYGIDNFLFNTDLVTSSITNANFVLPAGWSGDGAPPPNQGDGYGNFGIAAEGNVEQSPTLTFYLTGIAGDSIANYYGLSTGGETQGYSHFATHVRGFGDINPADSCPDEFGADPCTVTSSWFGDSSSVSVVPVPAAVWLFGSALGMLRLTSRRPA